MPAHIVGHIPNAWGHIKPLLALFAHFAEHRPADALVLTLLSSGLMMPKIQRELEHMSEEISQRFTIIDVGASGPIEPMVGFNPVFEALWKQEPVICKTTNREITGLPRPSVVLLDLFCGYALPVVKEVSNGKCPIITWASFPLSNVLRLAGPESMGGYGDMQAKIMDLMAKTSKTLDEAADKIFMTVNGDILKTPGLPPVYNYEAHPQELNFPVSPAVIIQGSHRLLKESDGVLAVSVSAYEPGCIDASRDWLKSIGKDLWIVGPLDDVPASATRTIRGGEVPRRKAEDTKILSFLDLMQAEYGDRSVVVIAFGTFFYPTDTAKLHAFIDELIVSGTPFLWGHASPSAVVPTDLAIKLEATRTAFHANWIPQRDILQHAATGWFVSHGGWNSVQDALSLKVPMIFWPFTSDQPINATILSTTHQAAFELLSVRSGPGAQPPYRHKDEKNSESVTFSVDGVRRETRLLLARLKSEEGARVRANAERLSGAMNGLWEKGGEANMQMEAFLETFVDSAWARS